MLKFIDYYLDRITMYRLVLYTLMVYIAAAAVFGALHLLPFSLLSIFASAIFLLIICGVTNYIFAWAYDVPVNFESMYITALILSLIISPVTSVSDFVFLFWAAVLAMASKYILAINRKHLFNPAAVAVVITSYVIGQSASWWVGTSVMMPLVLVGGFLIIRKLRFFDLAWSFFSVSLLVSFMASMLHGGSIFATLNQYVLHSFFLFFGTIMVTEPLTLPPTKNLQMVGGALVGLLSVPLVHVGSLYFAPELALCIANIYAYIVSPKTELFLHVVEKNQIASDILEFVFRPKHRISFTPGQYMEWTIADLWPDSRGNRRYFTLASSPTEDVIRLGVRIFENGGSSFKHHLRNMDSHTKIGAGQIAGNFTLPKDKNKKLAFIAGGIGITPFRSMLKYLVDTNEKRDIVLFYANKTADEIAYKIVFEEAQTQLGIRTVYTLTDTASVPQGWQGEVGRLQNETIARYAPDYQERTFYLSGPYAMITAYEELLQSMGVKQDHIKKDFFPGLV